ncbi:MAG: amino acid adenylation domain-containing protein [Gammaproteobacteria bacterium]|nr:amino acid adenylation domain-containing protein [Gammaproteobacteria bacterium]
MLTTDDIQALSREEQELFFLLLQEEGIDLQSSPITPQTTDQSSYPLSYAQRRIWLLNQLDPKSTAYHMFGVLHLNGAVDHAVLARSFGEVIKRHDILRASFHIEDNHPIMRINDSCAFQLKWVDFSYLQTDESNATVQDIIREAHMQAFDLSQPGLIRASLVKLSDIKYLLLFATHHIIADAWSLNVLIRELSHFYQSMGAGHTDGLPELPIQYSDYAVWQQNLSQSFEFNKSVAYWIKQLKDGENTLNLPADAMRPPLQTSKGKKLMFTISEALSDKIKALSSSADVSLFVLLLSVFQVLLFRYSSQTNFMIGSVISNRNRRELEALIGLFADTLVLRTDLSGNPTFQELLIRTKRIVLEAFQHQAVPFDLIVEKLNVKRELSHHPLFQVMFVYESRSEHFNIADIQGEQLEFESGHAKFDLTFFVEDKGAFLSGAIEYNIDLFLPETIHSYLESYLALLENISIDASKKISELPLVREQQAKKLLSWQDDSGPAKNFCLHQYFEKWVDLTPNEIAVSFMGLEISYQQLNQRSNEIAHKLIQLGVKKNQFVAIMLEVGIDQIAALLAVCKSGAGFICLDQHYPKLRLMQILEEVKPFCVISDASSLKSHHQNFLLAQQEAHYEASIINLSEDDVLDVFTGNPKVDVVPSDPVYIVYTSGSTGKPKGILQTHGCSIQYMEWQSNQFQIQPKKRMAQWASITYDASYSEIFGALCFGATLCVTAPLDRRDPKVMMGWLELAKITVIQLVPSFCKLLLQCMIAEYATKQTHVLENLEYVLLAGESLPVKLAREFQGYFNHKTKLYNLYGPSEIVLATQYCVDNLPPALTNISIGAPFVGRQILILDSHGALCPLRVPGEIYIKSPYLTQGYFQQPEETGKVFIQNPLHDDYPDRVYKTGDRGRWLNEHEIEFLGRKDNQVKIRGSRVEVGEVEAVLLRHEAVRESAVIVKRHFDDTVYLDAFVSGEREIDTQVLKNFLVSYLPTYMMPSHIFFLENFPRTISGKIDRKMLAVQSYERQETSETAVAPENEIEKDIAAVWQALLGVSSVCVNSNFFDLGGHSLLLVQVQMALSVRLKQNIALIDLFKYPTIKSLANFLSQTTEFALPQGQQRALLRKKLSKRRHNLTV